MTVKRTKKTKKKSEKNSKTIVKCILTDEECTYSTAQLVKLIKRYKFDDIDTYIQYFICKNGINLLKQGYTEKQIREQYNCNNKTTVPFNILKHYVKKFKNRQKIEKLEKRKAIQKYMDDNSGSCIVTQKKYQTVDFTNKEQVKKLTEGACWRPDIYLNNERACNGCYLFEHCACPIKKWNNKLSEPKQRRR